MPLQMSCHSRRVGHVRLVLAAAAVAGLVGITQAPAIAAAANPYSGSGYDASYPSAQCTGSSYPSGFAIIGLGGGRPFTTSTCLSREWSLASANGGSPGIPSLYFNTGYSGAYAKQITTGCKNEVGNAPIPVGTSRHQMGTEQQAWEIGCSEVAYAAASAPGTPAMWWADVETSNSWSNSTIYNDFAIDGIAYEMSGLATATGAGGGVYSTPAMWSAIAGAGFVPTPAVTGDWLPASTCPASGFAGAPVWLIQNGTVTTGGASFSVDQAC